MFSFFKISSILLILFLLNSCGKDFFKRSDVTDNPVNVDERVQRNIEEGKGIRFRINEKGGTFDFASSNELWRASVDILDFVPLTNASYSGGIIITDWFIVVFAINIITPTHIFINYYFFKFSFGVRKFIFSVI